jgi:hypothetical protein
VTILENSLFVVNNSQFTNNFGSINVPASGSSGGGAIYMNDM